jgi:predicted secreted protein
MEVFMRFFLVSCVVLSGFVLTGPAMAQEVPQSLVRSGQTVLNISASERQTVQQDLLIASVRFETEGTDSRTLQDKINQLVSKALDESKKYTDVKVVTDNYYVYPYDPNQYVPRPDGTMEEPKEKKPVIWRGAQGLSLKSKNSEQLLKLMGSLQEMGFQTNNLSYTLSPESFETIRDSLMESALAKLKVKADRASKALGKKEAELVEVSVDTAYPQYPQPMMARAEMAMDAGASAKFAAPVASPGESEITLTVSARAVLK